ncbi:uncharacterized protein FMAN_14253 [Fusarium mangiferae]|uniref:Uncharacterized protein n=1 Tax=Fusarium mangiferae TaxID=192010 RepID=A0A1L7UMW4_FUSMA|nr:uncharacterized protein FMAN_14253 [Fusarium mangiferae]CVL09107.1 uncharacterized protein FMAN_14253 [Fusarium mangiferae]
MSSLLTPGLAYGANDVELRYLAKEMYPHLPYEEALLKICQDTFVRFPSDFISRIARGAINDPVVFIEGVGDILSSPFKKIIAAARFYSLYKNGAPTTKKSIASAAQPSVLVEALNIETFALTVRKSVSPTIQPSVSTGALNIKQLRSLLPPMTESISDATDKVSREIHGIHVIGKSLVDHLNYYGRWMQTVSCIQIAQAERAIEALNIICNHLGDANTITVSGASGPDGFARPVYDFILKSISDIDPRERHMHRFFVFHPDTNWYGAFHRLLGKNRLPAEFCAKADNLDTICRFMQDIRKTLIEESSAGRKVVFHLLIPSWYTIHIREPLHFPASLHPLRVKGEKHKGKELVEMNLPAAPANMLNGVANVLDPKYSNRIAKATSLAVTLPAVGWGVNGACLALGIGLGTLTGLGALVTVPVWIGTAMPAMSVTAPVMLDTIHSTLREGPARILGSKDILGRNE